MTSVTSSETTSWRRLCFQNPSRAYLDKRTFANSLRNFSATLCEPSSQKLRLFLLRRNFPLYARGLLGCLLGFWPSGPKPWEGNYKHNPKWCLQLCVVLQRNSAYFIFFFFAQIGREIISYLCFLYLTFNLHHSNRDFAKPVCLA